MTKKPEGTTSRRDFLKLASTAVPAAAVAVVVSDKAEAAVSGDDAERMRDTVHTRAYYESARF